MTRTPALQAPRLLTKAEAEDELPHITRFTPIHLLDVERFSLGLTLEEAQRAFSRGTIKYYEVDGMPFLTKEAVIEYKARPDVGLVYVIKFDRYLKIGFTRDLRSRLNQIQSVFPVKLEVIHTFVGQMVDERETQKKFWDYRVRGEWFKNCAAIRQWVRRMH